jgi:hypothetical protein
MGKTSIMALAAFLVVGATRQLQVRDTEIATEHRDAQTRFEMLARNAAHYGFERAKQYAASPAPVNDAKTGVYMGAGYSASITFSGDVAKVRAIGMTQDATGAVIPYRIVSDLKREITLPSAAPQFMQFALLSQSDLTLSGSILVDTFRVEGDTRAPSNANVHTNGTLKVNGAAALVRGFGTYTVNKQVGQETKVFRPYSNPTGAAVLAKTTAVTLPAFSPAAIAAALTPDLTSPASVTLATPLDVTLLGATRDDPFVWHVKGNLDVSSAALIKGYVVFLVDGALTLSGGESVALNNGFSESNAAWYTGGDITLKGNSEIWGQFYSAAGIRFSGTPRIYGSVATRGAATISGNPSVYYVPGSPALTTYWQPPIVRLRRLSYSEGW